MKNFKFGVLLILFFVSVLAVKGQVNKAPANPNPIEYQQPDGTMLLFSLKGDEYIHWGETIDGYTLLSNKKGGYVYAKLNSNGDLVKTCKMAHQENKRTKKEVRFLKNIPKGLRYSDSQIEKMRKKTMK